MELTRLTDRVWVSPFEKERDRPSLGYVRGDRWSLAIDAGHSADHLKEFYQAIENIGLPLPSLTALTHWHWDHTFAMHAANGLTVANVITNEHLANIRNQIARDGAGVFLSMDECVRREYANGQPVVVTLADVVFSGELSLDAGNCPIRLFQADSPHTDDSTLVHVPNEGVLFFGDSKSGAYPTWVKNPVLCYKLADAVENAGAALCVGGHWPPMTKEELVGDLRSVR